MRAGNRNPSRKTAPYLRRRSISHPSKSLEYFKNCPWDLWWQEFLTSRQKSGRMTYLTAFQFARAKAKSSEELNVIYKAIGPKPVLLDKAGEKKIPAGKVIPYLGDWQQIRLRSYFYDNESVDRMKKIVEEKLDGLEAGRGAATIVLDLIAKWAKYDEKIDEVYDSAPVVEGLNKTQQEKRARLFFYLKKETMGGLLKLIDKYLACHGISTDGMNDLGQLVMAVSNSAAKNALTGAATGAVLGQRSQALEMLAGTILQKAEIFHMPLPAAVTDDGQEDHEK